MTEPPRPPWEGNPGDNPPPDEPPNYPGGAQQYRWHPGGPTGPAGPPPAGYPSAEDRNWVLAAHFGGAVVGFFSTGVLGWIVPLVAMLARGNQSAAVRQHAVNALNFQILWAIVAAAGYILGTCLAITVVGLAFYIAVPVAMFMELVVGLIAGARANDGQLYRYPMSVNFIK